VSNPADYRPAAGTVPDLPGVYRFRDEHGRVVYVGKAISLRSRLASYFADPATLHPRTHAMVHAAASVEWTTVNNEVEALQLEYAWIKEFDPRFNVKYRDDKSYPYLAITLDEEYPRALVMRGAKRKGVRYFGPYAHAWAIRDTLDQLLRVFPVRTCSKGVFKRAGQVGRPCLLGYIGKCSAPCVGRVSADEHRELVDDLVSFLSGDIRRLLRQRETEMREAAAMLDFERAARLRDDIAALQRALERSAVVLPDDTDADIVGVAEDPLEAAVQLFQVRGGRVRGQRGWVVDRVEDLDLGGLVEQFLLHTYAEDGEFADDVPREVLVPARPADAAALEELLSAARGARVAIRVPQRGDKRALLQTVTTNAAQSLATHKTRRASDLTARSRALEELQDALDLPEAPLRIEGYDVANLAGQEVVASMVVFEDALPRKSEYRRFVVKGVDGQNDVAAMHEVVPRRFRRLLDERPADVEDGDDDPRASLRDPQTGRPRRFAYPPQLVVVDGGAPQVAAAQRAMAELGVTDVTVVGLAKRLEEVWVAEDEPPVILPRSSEALYLLQRLRDEAHRFANTFHRERRSRRMTASVLDDVPGLGEVRRKALLRHFGSLKRLKAADVEEVAEVPGIGPATAELVVAALHPTPDAAATAPPRESGQPVVNTATGEILE
jgi:excinuclease ABC subunit C